MNDHTPMTETVREAYRFWIEAKNNARYGKTGREPVARTEATAEFERWLATVKAEAWDEGHRAGTADWLAIENGDDHHHPNPYREKETT